MPLLSLIKRCITIIIIIIITIIIIFIIFIIIIYADFSFCWINCSKLITEM